MQRSILWRWAAALALLLPAACSDPNDWNNASANVVGRQPWLTQDFEQLRLNAPALDELGMSVGKVRPFILQKNSLTVISEYTGGSAILLDRYGTVALTNHQSKLAMADFVFIEFTNPKTGSVLAFKANIEFVDESLDLSFATIVDSSELSFGISDGFVKPVTWGQTQYGKSAGVRIISGGYPGDKAKLLHATPGVIYKFYDSRIQSGKLVACRLLGEGNIYDGMSGGFVTDSAGKTFLGQLTGAMDKRFKFLISYVTLFFTPSEAIYNSYRIRYPHRAKDNPFPDFDERSMPDSCKDHAVPYQPPRSSRPLDTVAAPNSYAPANIDVLSPR